MPTAKSLILSVALVINSKSESSNTTVQSGNETAFNKLHKVDGKQSNPVSIILKKPVFKLKKIVCINVWKMLLSNKLNILEHSS